MSVDIFDCNFATPILCPHCSGDAPLIQILRDLSVRTEREAEVRLFECRACKRHSVLELAL